MRDSRRVFLISAGGTPDALREVIGLLRSGWQVVESRPADSLPRGPSPAPGLGEGPFSVIVVEKQSPAGAGR